MRLLKICALAAAGMFFAVSASADYEGVPRTFLWNPGTVDIYDAAEHKKDGPYVIGFSNASLSNPWRVAMLHGIEAAAERNQDKLERFIITDANDNPSKQAADIQDLLAQGVDILLVSPATAEALDPALRRANKSGVPIVLVDREVTSKDSYITFVTASDQALGRISAQWLAETLNFEGKIVMLGGLAGASPAENRITAAHEVFNQYPGIEVLEVQYTSWSPANGKTIMAALIQKYGQDIAGVWADSGLQGSGSIEAFLAAGYEAGSIPPHTGGDFNAMYRAERREPGADGRDRLSACHGRRVVRAAVRRAGRQGYSTPDRGEPADRGLRRRGDRLGPGRCLRQGLRPDGQARLGHHVERRRPGLRSGNLLGRLPEVKR